MGFGTGYLIGQLIVTNNKYLNTEYMKFPFTRHRVFLPLIVVCVPILSVHAVIHDIFFPFF